MKRTFRFSFAVMILVSTIYAWAARPVVTPVVNAVSHPAQKHPRIHQIVQRILNQFHLTALDEKNKKITQQQATEIRASLKSIHQQQVTDLKTNTNHELTSEQQSEMNSQLDKNSQVLGEKPTPTNY